MPIDYSKYPKNWKTEIRPAILERAKNCCEDCGVPNYSVGYRNDDGKWNDVPSITPHSELSHWLKDRGYKVIKIVLTIAHMNNDIKDNRHENLKALCQRCHNIYDLEYRKQNRKKTMLKKKANLRFDL